MKYLEQIQRGIDFIETHLAFDLDTAEVARHAGISHWHFQRIFKALTHETLKTYIRSRRLAVALEALLVTEQRIIEVAVAAGFQSQESFTRASSRSIKPSTTSMPTGWRAPVFGIAVLPTSSSTVPAITRPRSIPSSTTRFRWSHDGSAGVLRSRRCIHSCCLKA
jgi:AraC-like DNA-binding protein